MNDRDCPDGRDRFSFKERPTTRLRNWRTVMETSMTRTTLLIVFTFAAISLSCQQASPPGGSPQPSSTNLQATAPLADDLKKLCQCLEKFGPPAPVLDPAVLPVDVSLEDNTKCKYRDECPNANGCCQPCFDCYGWQLFVALNWPAKSAGEPDPGKSFGDPGEYANVVWQSYKSAFEIFGDTEPTPWGTEKPFELQLNSAVIPETFLKADLQSDHNWLTDQDGEVVRYEIRINKDEFGYIIKNDLWNQEGLFKAVTTTGIDLPSQKSEFGDVGAIEVKAAWRIIPEARRSYFEQNYKTAHAKVYDPASREWKDRDVALVGMHIIKKTPHSPQWVWATFEHKDNAPVEGDPGKDRKWNFFNPDAAPDYTPSYKAPPTSSTPRNRPVQVVRVKQPSSDDGDVKGINDAMHKLIEGKFPRSVWRNYDLISLQWPVKPNNPPNNPTPDPRAQKVLPSGQPRPRVLANTSMETYVQTTNSGGGAGLGPGKPADQGPEDSIAADDLGKSSCIACHRISAVTPKFVNHPNPKGWWTDYSTVFFKAVVKKPVNDNAKKP
jgi:hypothetical protein